MLFYLALCFLLCVTVGVFHCSMFFVVFFTMQLCVSTNTFLQLQFIYNCCLLPPERPSHVSCVDVDWSVV